MNASFRLDLVNIEMDGENYAISRRELLDALKAVNADCFSIMLANALPECTSPNCNIVSVDTVVRYIGADV